MQQQRKKQKKIDKNTQDIVGSTILRFKKKKKLQTTQIISIPVYARMQVLNLITLDTHEMAAQVNAILRIVYFYGNIEPMIIEKMKSEMIIEMSNKQNILLDPGDVKIDLDHDKDKKTLEFTFRNNFGALIVGDVFWSPYEKYYLLMTIKLGKLIVEKEGDLKRKTQVVFNLMEPQNKKISTISFSQERTIGFYEVSPYESHAEFTFRKVPHKSLARLMNIKVPKFTKKKRNEKKGHVTQKQAARFLDLKDTQQIRDAFTLIGMLEKQQDVKKKMIPFNYMHTTICLFRRPVLNFCTIIIPMVMISLLNFFTFFINYNEEQAVIKKINSIITTMVSFIALIYQIRKQLPAYDGLTFIQILLLLQLITTLMATAQTFRLNNLSDEQQQNLLTPQFILTCGLTTITLLGILVHLLYFVCYRLKNLRLDRNTLGKTPLQRDKWNNALCNFYYYLFSQKHPNIKHYDEQKQDFINLHPNEHTEQHTNF